jgi:hypothetical protein
MVIGTQYTIRHNAWVGIVKSYTPLAVNGIGHLTEAVMSIRIPLSSPIVEMLIKCQRRLRRGLYQFWTTQDAVDVSVVI